VEPSAHGRGPVVTRSGCAVVAGCTVAAGIAVAAACPATVACSVVAIHQPAVRVTRPQIPHVEL